MQPMSLDITKVEARRKELGLTQEEAAKKSKLPGRSYWNDIVSGRRSNITLEVLDNIARALNVSARDLIK